MKKLLLSAIIIALVGSTCFIGCKRGENDPFFSVRSRDSRITGDWELVEVKGSTTYTYTGTGAPDNSTATDTYDGTTWTEASGGQTTAYAYSETVVIDKDGTYERTIVDDGETSIYKGDWFWLDSKKDKLHIMGPFSLTRIDQLKTKELILIEISSSTTPYYGDIIQTATYDETYTYEKK